MYKFKLVTIFTAVFSFVSLGADLDCNDISTDFKTSIVNITNNHHLYYCLGYLHAKDRGWQMDFFRRNAYGESAEIYGFSYLKTDTTMRTLSVNGFATTLWNNLSAQHKEKWIIYSEGVNKAYKTEKMGREFKAKGIKPPIWNPIDSISVYLLFSLDHSPNSFQQKIDLNFPNLYDVAPNFTTFIASQNNVKTNSTLLAFNSNIALKTPVLWYLSVFNFPENEFLFGTSIPGIPFFYNGINKNFAWNINHSFPDLLKYKLINTDESKQVQKFSPVLWFSYKFFKIPYFSANFYQTKSGKNLIKTSKSKKNVFYEIDWSDYTQAFNSLLSLMETQVQLYSKKTTTIITQINSKHFKIAAIDKNKNIFSNSNTFDYHNNKFFQAKIIIPSEYAENDVLYDNKLKRERTIEKFNSFTSMTQESAMSVLCDNKVKEAEKFVPAMIELIRTFPKNEVTSQILYSLFAWDHYITRDCSICVFYDVWLKYLGREFEIPRHKMLSFLKNLPSDKYDDVYLSLIRAFRDTKEKQWFQVAVPSFDHLGIIADEQLSNTWQLAHLLPTVGFKNTINALDLSWIEEARAYRPTSGSSMKMVFQFAKGIPKAWISLSGKNKWYERLPDPTDFAWKEWSKCKFYQIKINKDHN